MTIRRGATWGRVVDAPADLRVVDGDAVLAAVLAGGSSAPVRVRSGDLARTVGVGVDVASGRVRQLPIDLVDVTLADGVRLTAVAHVVARRPWWRGSWWRGPIVAAMNAEFLDGWDVAPRGHPNDGRIECIEVDAALSIRQRWAARRRLPTGTHVPHPAIRVRSATSATWVFDDTLEVWVDGRAVGRSGTLSVEVRPDAAVIYA